MLNMIESCKTIYDRLEDEKSRKIFELRLLHSLVGDNNYIKEILALDEYTNSIFEKLEGKRKYIYSAGARGKRLQEMWGLSWDGFIEKNPNLAGKEIDGLLVIGIDEIEKYNNSYVVVPNKFGGDEIVEELISRGVKSENIICLYKKWNELVDRQYFDLGVLPHCDNEIFLDIGAFDGYSAKQFIEWAEGKYEKIYEVEPDKKNAELILEKEFSGLESNKVEIINKAAWNRVERLKINSDGQSSVVSDEGDYDIDTFVIDECIEKVTFLKMDIEGAEYNALLGAKKLIQNNCPKLAIAIYHKPEDIIEIAQLILEYCPEYKFYLRHYSMVDWDTVLSAIAED